MSVFFRHSFEPPPLSSACTMNADISSPLAAVVLCGGESTRMGFPKAELPFGSETMLQRVVRIVSTVARPVVAVCGADQPAPPLHPEILVARDRRGSRGPLEGLHAGLTALEGSCQAAFVCSCDLPLLQPAVIASMAQGLTAPGCEDYDAFVPWENQRWHPLTAVYRLRVLPEIARLLAGNELRMTALLERLKTKRIDVSALRPLDGELDSFRNINRPEDYLAALARAGLPRPEGPLPFLDQP